ncbi:MAG: hypothetical protein M3Y06_10355 [Actinomycetota bacterium]|nr:hypothetical protein [Actinomycetota bacterium]
MSLSACADKEPAPAVSSKPAAAATSPGPQTQPPVTSSATTPALPGMPVPVSAGSSPVDPATIRSIDDLPKAFGCPTTVAPIRIPATPTATPAPADPSVAVTPAPPSPVPPTPVPPTSPAGPPAPDAVVCTSGLAKEALYLWYAPTPEAKLGALTVALKRAKYVHGGPNWVAGGMVDPKMGTVGGEVYR